MDPVNPPPSPRDPTRKPPVPPGKGDVPPYMRALLWQIPIILIFLWFWQEYLSSKRVETIPYSEFKQYVAAGAVTECQI